MSDLATLYARNAAFAQGFDKGDLPVKPSLSTIILTCVDARVGPEHVLGVELGDCLVLRTVGGRATDAAATEAAILWTLMELASGQSPDLELAIIQHTQCGMARFAIPEVAAKVTERFGTSAIVDTYAIADLEDSVRDDVERLRSNPLVPAELTVTGHVYDVTTGRMREVVGA